MDKRTDFLEQFLGALGARRISWSRVEPEFVQGTVTYDLDDPDPDEKQDFIWEISESCVPRNEVRNLAALLHAEGILSIDKITIGRKELRKRWSAYTGVTLSETEFAEVLDELEAIEIPMLDDGAKTDIFFIHE